MLLIWYTPPPEAFSIYIPEKRGGYTLEEEDDILFLAYYYGWIE